MTICSPFCPFVRDCSFDCPAPGGDPQATLVFAGGDGSSDVTETATRETMADVSDPRDAPTSGGPAGTYVGGPTVDSIPTPSAPRNPINGGGAA